jgi:hypothetical protein
VVISPQLSPTNVDVPDVTDAASDGAESHFDTAVLHSCRESRVDLPNLAAAAGSVTSSSQAKIDVAEQVLFFFFFLWIDGSPTLPQVPREG